MSFQKMTAHEMSVKELFEKANEVLLTKREFFDNIIDNVNYMELGGSVIVYFNKEYIGGYDVIPCNIHRIYKLIFRRVRVARRKQI